jgi:hypothetical protein
MKTMKALLLGGAASLALACALRAQTPTPIAPSATPFETVMPAATMSPVPSATSRASDDLADKIKQRVDKKFKHKGGFGITIDDDDSDEHTSVHHGGDVIPHGVFPIVAISILGVFGFPVAIVAVIMFSSWAKSRSLQRTVRMMVEKGQPVPPELFAAPAGAPLRPWYDLRRGIVLLSVGTGLMLFFGLTAGWDEGVWALGLIPGLIGLGYILAWRLANRHGNGFNK